MPLLPCGLPCDFFILSLLINWHSQQLDFTIAFPRAPVEVPLYMSITTGYSGQAIPKMTHTLKLLRNIYGQNQEYSVGERTAPSGIPV